MSGHTACTQLGCSAIVRLELFVTFASASIGFYDDFGLVHLVVSV